MNKKLIGLAIVVILVLVVLWVSLRGGDETVTPPEDTTSTEPVSL